jgi:hypothetical protein
MGVTEMFRELKPLEAVRTWAQQSAPRLAPWEAEPRRLWSFNDMRDVGMWSLFAAIVNLERTRTRLHLRLQGAIRVETAEAKANIAESLETLKKVCLLEAQFPFPASLVHQLLELQETATGEPYEDMVILARLDGILTAVGVEIGECKFLFVPPVDKHFYESPRTDFGSKVEQAFPGCLEDVDSAGKCLACDMPTACVFHLMRVLEAGLHALAKNLNVTMAATIELENWQNIIDQIESKIDNEKAALVIQRKRSPVAADKLTADIRLQKLSEIAVEFSYFKDAWRNHVNHRKEPYDIDRARSIWNHVRWFMQKMADVV